MAAEIRLTKTNDSPWGFRLTGGRDFGTPLTILKVTVHSVAEEAGLQVGDILVKINAVDTNNLTHKEAQDLILQAKDSVCFSVLRGNLNLSEDTIERLTPLPLRDFSKTPEPRLIIQEKEAASIENVVPAVVPEEEETKIEIIEIKDLDPDQLEELGLTPLPEDFVEKARRDASPIPEVRPHSAATSGPDILDTLEDMGLHDIVEEIERQKEELLKVADIIQEEITSKVDNQLETNDGTLNDTQTIDRPLDQVLEPNREDQFVEIMSGKAEVLEGSALGVDFKKFEPQADFLRKSQVFQTIQETEKTEKEKPRWTTFMEKPKRPIVKPKPKIKPPEPVREPSPENLPPPERHGIYEIPPEEEFEALVKVPTPPPQEEQANAEPELEEQPDQEGKETETIGLGEQVEDEITEAEVENLQQQIELEKELNPALFGDEKSDIELQLEEIQKQLQAIQQLPFEIQQHLQLVQQQLNNIVQHRIREQECEIPPAPRPSMVADAELLTSNEELEQLAEMALNEEINEENLQESEPVPQEDEPKLVEEDKVEKGEEDSVVTMQQPPIVEECNSFSAVRGTFVKPKAPKPKKRRPFNGIGPAPRPLILPGGRRWRTPKDAYNDQFISETLTAQAEIIAGTTLGVNFRKYEPKQPTLNHLRDSIVYKMIHDLEDPNLNFASRPEIIPALQDYVQSAM